MALSAADLKRLIFYSTFLFIGFDGDAAGDVLQLIDLLKFF